MAQMTSLERVRATVKGEDRDRAPVQPMLMTFAGRWAGIPFGDYCRRAEHMVAAQLRVWRDFDLDILLTCSDPAREVIDLCGEDSVRWYDDQPPAIDELNVVRTIIDEAAGRVPVIGGASDPDPSIRLTVAHNYLELGCAGLLVHIPYESEDSYIKAVTELSGVQPGILMLQDLDAAPVPVSLLARMLSSCSIAESEPTCPPCITTSTRGSGVCTARRIAAAQWTCGDDWCPVFPSPPPTVINTGTSANGSCRQKGSSRRPGLECSRRNRIPSRHA